MRLRDADQFNADLVELTKSALLRPFVTEHRAAVEKFERHVLDKAVRQHRADDTGSILGAQRHLFAAAIGKRVHLFGDDVGVLADRSCENFCELEDRRCHLDKAVQLGRCACCLAHLPMSSGRLRKKVLSAADRLQGTHAQISDDPREDVSSQLTPQGVLQRCLMISHARRGFAVAGTTSN